MRKHIQQTHEEVSHQCVSCKFEAFSPARLKKHKLFCHKCASKRDLQSRYCKKPFPFQINKLRRHELIHSDVANYLCEKCDFKTKTPQGLKNHSLYHEDPKNFCGECDYKSANLSTHKETKHGGVEHKCDKCGQNFQYLRRLLRHQSSHQSSQFNCNLCDKIFSRTDKLREHVQKEHGVEDTKALSCIHCQKTFSIRDKINVHMKHSCKQTPRTDPSSVH